MDQDKYRCLKAKLESNSVTSAAEGSTDILKGGIGMVNVNRRIKLRFGEEYGLFIQNILGGMTVDIRLPYQDK
ncbi:hypothetical protein D3C76_1695890 [compost metagenome]